MTALLEFIELATTCHHNTVPSSQFTCAVPYFQVQLFMMYYLPPINKACDLLNVLHCKVYGDICKFLFLHLLICLDSAGSLA